MQDDERCCGTGTCIIDAQGHCWCGQQWDGEKMCRPAEVTAKAQQASTGVSDMGQAADGAIDLLSHDPATP